jgi:3-oxoacyl-[acyl-carrier protein] reductase
MAKSRGAGNARVKTRGVVLVPGGARGIGRAIGLALAERGRDVAVAYRTSEEDARSFVEAAQAHGVRAVAIRADVSKPDEAERLVVETELALGHVDTLVHAAGPYRATDVLAETPEGWREMLDGNLSSFFFVARLVGPKMASRRHGRILAFALANADRLTAPRGIAGHYVAKVGVLVLVRTLAKALGPAGVTVNAISPGLIASGGTPIESLERLVGQVPAGYVGGVDDAVPLALYLLSDEARYVNGANVHLSGGWGL